MTWTRRAFQSAFGAVPLAGFGAAAAAGRPELPFRQVHLDFHTSELIPDVASDFRAADFGATLKAARVNSINVFAKCHHGMLYYDSKIGTRHPALKIDLLGEMVRACRASQIHVLYYYSLVWDVDVARKHPEWRMRDRAGNVMGGIPGDAWPWICMNTPYLDQVAAENEEIVSRYDVDGGWFDILKQPPDGCFCRWCVEDRRSKGIPDTPQGIERHNKAVALKVERRLNDVIHKRFPRGLTFYNSRLVIGIRDELENYSHIEIESLPTGGWGYSHFQQRVRYMRTLGLDMVGMTGRFHKSWGDFGGLKNQAALDFECLNFIANGAKCCVGDQLHPRGRLDRTTYVRIGETYRKIEALEPWARGTRAIADIGVISTAPYTTQTTTKIPPTDQGFTNMLVELHQQFNVLDIEEDLARYKVVIVPDEIPALPALLGKLDAYVDSGGAVIVSDKALVEGGRFAWQRAGVRYKGEARYKGEYMLAKPGAFAALAENPYFLYQTGSSVEAQEGTQTLATYGHPYFDRSAGKFSSHKQTPMMEATGEPLITQRGKVIYIANPFFASYAKDGVGALKTVVAGLLARLLPRPALLTPGLPSTAQATLLEQAAENRMIVHLLHYPYTRRAPDIDIIEEPAWLIDQEVRLRAAKAPSRVVLIPQQVSIPFLFDNGYVVCRLEKALGHQAICFEGVTV